MNCTRVVDVMIQVAAIAIIGAVLALFVRQMHSEYGVFILMGTGLVLLFLCLDGLRDIMEFLFRLETKIGNHGVYIKILCKLVGIAYISEFAGNICKDAGYQTLCTQVELAGKVCILVCALPILESMLLVVERVVGQ